MGSTENKNTGISEKSTTNQTANVSVDDLCLLANKYVDQKLYSEALNIYESAIKLFPDNLALKINLGRVKNLKNQNITEVQDFTQKEKLDIRKKSFFNKFQGLGEIYSKIGKIDNSKKIFELIKISNPDFYLPYLNLGKFFYNEKNYSMAIKELEECSKLNPFNEEAYNYLSLSYFYNGEYHKSLISMVDALLLSGDLVKDIPTSYQQKINLIVDRIEGFSPQMRNQLIRTRREKLNALYEEMEADIQALMEEQKEILLTKKEDRVLDETSKNLFDTAVDLKKHLLFKTLDDDALIRIAKFTQVKDCLKGDFVFREDEESKGLYVVKSGRIQIQRETPFGSINFASLESGSFFGEHDLITGSRHISSAACMEDSTVYLLEKPGFPPLFAKDKHIAIHFLWYFWKSLSFQIRESNSKMKEFFEVFSKYKDKDIVARGKTKKDAVIEINKKLEALEGKGLSSMEMRLLAAFSDSTQYRAGETIFKEGEPGDILYIVVDGEILISKNIEGIGEEALAVLKSGDFFGEMALMGDENIRSADAKANTDSRLIGIKKAALKEILSIDNDSSYQFLSILCKILSFRLKEINEKIYQWTMMQGGF